MRSAVVVFLLLQFRGAAQQSSLDLLFRATYGGKTIGLEQPLRTAGGDSLALHSLRMYLGHFVVVQNGQAAPAGADEYFLPDLEEPASLHLHLDLPTGGRFDSLRFELGVDSLTNTGDVRGGALDPTRGMYWTWQSGYINVKLEGFCSRSAARNHDFQFHLGGYLPPHATVQTVQLALPGSGRAVLALDLEPFFRQVDWAARHHIMSPSAEAGKLSAVLSQSFRLYAE